MMIENATLTGILTPDISNSTETSTFWTSASPIQSHSGDEKSYTGLIVGLSVAAAVALLSFLVALFIKIKYCRPVSAKGRSNGNIHPNDQDMFIIPGSGRSSQISAIENARTSLQEHPINPVCSFDDYVDIDISATIEQPSNLQLTQFVDVDLSPSSHNPIYEGLLDAIDENDPKIKSQEAYNNVQPLSTESRNTDKENVVFNAKSRKFSLQELKSKESENGQFNKKRNKSLPELPECNTTDTTITQPQLREVSTEKQMQKNGSQNQQECTTEEKRLKALKEEKIKKAKVSSLRSVLLEVDAYENIEVVKKQNKARAGITSMKEQPVQKETKQIPMRRAFSEQTRAPVPQPRKASPQKRKTFDPYDYPPGVPIPKYLIESVEAEDSEYIAHDPFADENTSAKRKTFDPYDYPPGVPIPKALIEAVKYDESYSADDNDTFETDAEYAFIESPGVYVAYDPEKDKAHSKLNEIVEDEYMNYSSKDFDENNFETGDKQPTASPKQSVLSDDPSPPTPCSTPYYVNEFVSVFDDDDDNNVGVDETQFVNESNSDHSNQASLHEIDDDIDDNYQNLDVRDEQDIYQNVSVSENQKKTNDNTEKCISASSDTDVIEEKMETFELSKSEKDIPTASSSDLRRYRSDDCGIYQNLVPPKPPRLHHSLGQFGKANNGEAILNTDNLTDVNTLPTDSLEDQISQDNAYEDVLVKQKRTDVKKDIEHEYMNLKRLS